MIVHDRIEILPSSLTSSHRAEAERFRRLAGELDVGYGWHYLLDFVWASTQLRAVRGTRLLDAGAGWGVMQWWLADEGADVVSVDLESRAHIEDRFRRWCRLAGVREGDYGRRPLPRAPRNPMRWPRYAARLLPPSRDAGYSHRGSVVFYTSDLRAMPDIASESVDAVVSISALEHIDQGDLTACVGELLRVLKPGGLLVATVGASSGDDWYHEPSKGWCFSEASLRRIFRLADGAPSNFDRYDDLMRQLRENEYLKSNLHPMYFATGDSGMPWGQWNPQYQSVGVVKVKA